jgi:hypothetical protein
MSVEIALQSTLVSGDHSGALRMWRAVQFTLRPPSADNARATTHRILVIQTMPAGARDESHAVLLIGQSRSGEELSIVVAFRRPALLEPVYFLDGVLVELGGRHGLRERAQK